MRTVGKIVTLPELNVPTTRHHDTDAITASHLHSRDRLHNVIRCITRRAAAVDVCRPPRGRPQCLDHVRGRRCGKGQGGTGVIQGIRRTHQGLELSELRSVQGWRGGRGDAGKGDRHDGHRTRSVSGFRGHREGRDHQVWGSEGAGEAGLPRTGLNGISGEPGGAVQRSPRPHVHRAQEQGGNGGIAAMSSHERYTD
jgi:hypothetical protein